ncbi:MAG: hypothetical protein C0598_10155, partial [Marinilabiliales bacterium]
MNIKIKLLIGLIILTTYSFAQVKISGRLIDAQTKHPLQNVNITLNNQSEGSISSNDGTFILSTEESNAFINFTNIGYKAKQIHLPNIKKDISLGDVLLEAQPYSLDEITINAGLRNEKDIPISISSVNSRTIKNNLSNRPLPLITQTVPGIFTVRDGGGSGDAKLSIRGFQQESVSLLLNGIPINGEENGLVYWSNWLGLSNSAAEIQIQKGPGLANASVNSIGGSINIITQNAEKEKSGSIGMTITDYGNINNTVSLNSGILKNGWNTSLMLGYGTGPGYVDATYVNSWSYFFTAAKQFNKKHKLSITLIGAPQHHGQRTIKLSNEEVEKKGLKFNKDWGGIDGKIKNASENFYHKPFLSINHEYKMNDKNIFSTSAYIALGSGGGKWSESFNYAPSIFSYRTSSDQIDWNTIYDNNANHEGTYTLDNGETVSGYSMNVQTSYLASHIQTGLIANFEHQINSSLKFQSGIHYRYFNSFLREEIEDLMGGNFYIEDYSWSLAGVAGRNQIKTVGDIIKVDNNSIINFANAYAQLLFDNNIFNAHLSVNANNNWYQRIDRFNYLQDNKSELVSIPGINIRSGVLYKINENNSVFVNAAYISRAPYFKFVFGNYTNVVVKDLENEKVQSFEAGYEVDWRIINAKFSGYYIGRQNVSLLSNEYVQLEDASQTRAMINGLDAIHKGIEVELSLNISRNLRAGGWFSMGDFKWKNNVNAKLLNDNNVVVDTINVFAEGLNIGGTARNQLGLFADINILRSIFLRFEYQYYSGVYSNFDPTSRNIANDIQQPYEFPAYGVLNTYLTYPF